MSRDYTIKKVPLSKQDITKLNWILRLFVIISVMLLHSLCYYMVNLINSYRPKSAFYDFTTVVDSWIPYISWTWIIYYFGDIYITLGAALIVWRLSRKEFIRAIYVYSGMIITGALIQLIFPAQAPWPSELIKPHLFFHDLISMRPYACLPAMHVSLTILPAFFLFSVTKSKWIRFLSTLLAVLISISTITLEEHFFLDMVAGFILAFVFYILWRWDFKIFSKK